MEIPIEDIKFFHISKMIFEKYQNNYKWHNKWFYKNENNEYIEDNEKVIHMLKNHILTYICEKYMDKMYENNKNIHNENNLKENIQIAHLIKKLYTKTFQNKIIKECIEFYYDHNMKTLVQ